MHCFQFLSHLSVYLHVDACGGGLILEGVASSGSGRRNACASAEAAVVPDAAMNAALGARDF